VGNNAEKEKLIKMYNELVMINQALIAKIGTTVITTADWDVYKQIPKDRCKVNISAVPSGMEISSAYTKNLDLMGITNVDSNTVERLGASAGDDRGPDDSGGDRDPGIVGEGPSDVGDSSSPEL